MGFLRPALLILIVAVAIPYLAITFLNRASPLPLNFGGHVEPGFEEVQKVFRENFANGLEEDGAAFAVYYKGKLVVDLWGGYADTFAARKWSKDTITVAFSTTKGAAALCIALLVDRGLLDYDALVTKYWPEFGQNHKENVTVKMFIGHQAGLSSMDIPITREAVLDWKLMSKIIEKQKPLWPAGTATGYHALTYGFLVDMLIRRVDPQHRSLGQFFKEEIAVKNDIDFHIGLPRSELYRVARLTQVTLKGLFKGCWDPRIFALVYNSMFGDPTTVSARSTRTPDWLSIRYNFMPYNNPEVQELEVAAANGIGTARGLARLYSLLDEPQPLLSKKTLDKISQPVTTDHVDKNIGAKLNCGWGFMYSKNPQGQYQLGHPGYGGQNAKFDRYHRFSLAYLRNNLILDMGDRTPSLMNLQNALYRCIEAIKAKHR